MDWIIAPLAIIAFFVLYGIIDYVLVQHRMKHSMDKIYRDIDREKKREQKKAQRVANRIQTKRQKQINASVLKYQNKQFTKHIANEINKDYENRIRKQLSSPTFNGDVRIQYARLVFPSWSITPRVISFRELGYADIENDIELEAFTRAVLCQLPNSLSYEFHDCWDEPDYCDIHYNLSFERQQPKLKKISDDPY